MKDVTLEYTPKHTSTTDSQDGFEPVAVLKHVKRDDPVWIHGGRSVEFNV